MLASRVLTTRFPLAELVVEEAGAHAEDGGDNHQGQHDSHPHVAHESVVLHVGAAAVVPVLGQLVKVQVVHAAEEDGHVGELHRLQVQSGRNGKGDLRVKVCHGDLFKTLAALSQLTQPQISTLAHWGLYWSTAHHLITAQVINSHVTLFIPQVLLISFLFRIEN